MSIKGLIIKLINNNLYQVYFFSLIRRISASRRSFNKIINKTCGNECDKANTDSISFTMQIDSYGLICLKEYFPGFQIKPYLHDQTLICLPITARSSYE